jgi:hypothetical protein
MNKWNLGNEKKKEREKSDKVCSEHKKRMFNNEIEAWKKGNGTAKKKQNKHNESAGKKKQPIKARQNK